MKQFLSLLLLISMTVLLLSCQKNSDGSAIGSATTTAATTVTTTLSSSDAVDTTTGTTESTGTTVSTKRTVTTRSRASATTTTQPSTNIALYPIKPTMSIEEASLRVQNNVSPSRRLQSEYVRVTEFDPEWAFMHHPSGIVYFKGKYYTAFSRGYEGEDFPGQQMVISVSDNFYDWSEPTVIYPSSQGTYGQTCIVPAGFYAFNDTLIANVYIHDYDESYFNSDGSFNPEGGGKVTTQIRQIHSTDGVNWSSPKAISSINTLSYPRQLSTGRWFSSTGKWMHYIDTANPSGLVKWNYYVMNATMQANSTKRNNNNPLTEGSWYEGPDGILHMMIRSDSGYMFHAESYDGGKSMTEFYPTRFSSDNTQFNFWNLKDGRAIAIGTPNVDENIWGMWPLNLYICTDGYNFNKAYTLRDEKYTIQKPGYSKGGEYAYMKMMEHDGYLYVFYSRMKEVLELTRVPLSELV